MQVAPIAVAVDPKSRPVAVARGTGVPIELVVAGVGVVGVVVREWAAAANCWGYPRRAACASLGIDAAGGLACGAPASGAGSSGICAACGCAAGIGLGLASTRLRWHAAGARRSDRSSAAGGANAASTSAAAKPAQRLGIARKVRGGRAKRAAREARCRAVRCSGAAVGNARTAGLGARAASARYAASGAARTGGAAERSARGAVAPAAAATISAAALGIDGGGRHQGGSQEDDA